MFQSVLRRLRDAQNAEFDGEEAMEGGFTLIELMVVLLIIAILLAIAIPTFLGVTGSANDRAAQSNLTNALTEAAAVYQGNSQSFAGISAALVSSAPEFTWTAANSAPAAGSNQISVETVDVATYTPTSDAQGVIVADLSKNSNTCWWAVQLDATPAVLSATLDTTGTPFEKAASGAGFQNGATTAGTFYAKKANAGSNCTASYPQTESTGAFNWGSSYASPGVN
jgi:type IV pilus assembly protein PilA